MTFCEEEVCDKKLIQYKFIKIEAIFKYKKV